MNRAGLLLLALMLLSGGAGGCRSCQGHLDYCGPLPDEPCDFMYRRNSILGGDRRPEAMAAMAEAQAKEQAETAGEAGGEMQEEENVPTPAPALEEGEPATMPQSPETGIAPEVDPYALDDAPMSSEMGFSPPVDRNAIQQTSARAPHRHTHRAARPSLFGRLFR